jgi:glycosyltransferase involved in cell wall biosynthesis
MTPHPPNLPGGPVGGSPSGTGGRLDPERAIKVALLTGGDDRPYALGLTSALVQAGVFVEFIGSNRVDGPELHGTPWIRFLNLRGDQTESAPVGTKVRRLINYYGRLLRYAVTARPRIFHILWNNKFEWFDRTLLMLHYRLMGRRVVMTVHNVNVARRDGYDSAFNRFTLGIQYRLASHLFVHTAKMKAELMADFAVPAGKVSLIPFAVNDKIPITTLTPAEARQRLGLEPAHQVALAFGQIAPYKGLDQIVAVLPEIIRHNPQFRLVIAGKVKHGFEGYWEKLRQLLSAEPLRNHVLLRIEHIPDDQVETLFKAADVSLMPYTEIFQSGVLFLAYTYGLPVLAADVGSFREDVEEGVTGWICRPQDPADLVRCVRRHFESPLHQTIVVGRGRIQKWAMEKYSPAKVAEITRGVYKLLGGRS